jgi:hypothetical protein
VSRRADPERIFAAKKAATIERLVGDGIPRTTVEAWVESWEGGAADIHDLRRDLDFWENGYQYVRREYDAGHKPPPPPDISSDRRDPRL